MIGILGTIAFLTLLSLSLAIIRIATISLSRLFSVVECVRHYGGHGIENRGGRHPSLP